MPSPETAQQSTTILAGQQSYNILRPLGSGGMGQVFLVQAIQDAKPIALKFLQAGLTSKIRIDAFKREFRLLSELHHPHVCRVYDFGFSSSHQQYFFTAEFVEGEDLYRALLQAPIDQLERVLAQVLSALDFIHSVGLIHFDVKGANILVSRTEGQIQTRLVDFGVTSPTDQPIKEIAGTLNYMAPELFAPNPRLDHRVDLYSLGVVCYRLLSGLYPYELHSLDEAKAFHEQTQIDWTPLRERGAPEYLSRLTQRLLAPNPDDRFPSAAAVLSFLTLHAGHEFLALPRQARVQLAEGPFVGREHTLVTLQNAVKRVAKFLESDESVAQEEHPQAYLIAGARGMGKSRLLAELKHASQLEECVTIAVDGEREGRDVLTFLPALGLPPEELPETPEAAAPLLMQSAASKPTCFLIDNLDRAALPVQKSVSALLGLLYSATLSHEASPLIVVATYTPTAGAPPQASGTPTLELTPLPRDAVHAFVTQLVGTADGDATFLNAVWNFSHGVPLLMSEAARRYHTAAGELPTSIEDLYRQQVEQLSTEARELLELLAFADRPLTAAVCSLLASRDSAAALLELYAAGLVQRDGTLETYSPATGALTQVIAKGLPETRRQQLADLLLTWLATQADIPARELAVYAPYTSHREKAVTILEHAAKEAEQVGATETAIQFLERRLEYLRVLNEQATEQIVILRKIATLRLFQGRYQACEEILQQLLTAQTDPAVEDLKMLGLAKRAQRKPQEAGEIYEQALAKLSPDPSNPVYLFLLNERAQAWLETGATEKAIELYQRSHTWTKELPADKRRQVTNNNLGVALARSGRFDHALAFYQEKLAEFGHDKRLASSIHGQLGVLHLHAGQGEEALAAFLEAWRLSLAMGAQHNALALLDNIITLCQKKAAYSEALKYAQLSFQIKASSGAEVDLASSLMTVATLYLNLGTSDLAARYLTQAMRLARRARNHRLLGWIQITFGYLYKDLGRLMESLNAFEETMAIGETHHDENLQRWGYYGAIDLLVENGEIEEANQFITRLTPLMPTEQDAEFKTRYTLLTQKIAVMTQLRPDDPLGPALVRLANECLRNGWRELHWEAEYLLGIYYHKRDEIEDALAHLRTAYEIIMTMVANLGEEYREPFLKQRSRARVLVDLKTISRIKSGGVSVAALTNATAVTGEARDGATRSLDTAAPATPPDATAVTTAPRANLRATTRFTPNKALATYEREILQAAVTHFAGDLERVAASLGLGMETLIAKLSQYGIE
ncbi:MAG: protein kinase [Deltaproteobacteria bacterium]|nr:protein kinase [Deltaproteobacteria bacterium]